MAYLRGHESRDQPLVRVEAPESKKEKEMKVTGAAFFFF
jgi:hypothetical protein